MKINYNIAGPERKLLAGALAEILAIKAVYQGMPTAKWATTTSA
jgi:hypothetical protein